MCKQFLKIIVNKINKFKPVFNPESMFSQCCSIISELERSNIVPNYSMPPKRVQIYNLFGVISLSRYSNSGIVYQMMIPAKNIVAATQWNWDNSLGGNHPIRKLSYINWIRRYLDVWRRNRPPTLCQTRVNPIFYQDRRERSYPIKKTPDQLSPMNFENGILCSEIRPCRLGGDG